MADQDAGSRGAEDEPRGPRPEPGSGPLPPRAVPAPPPRLGSGYAYGPGGAGWNAPGWAAPPPRPAPVPPPPLRDRLSRRLPAGQNGRLVAVGVASAVVGALVGGGIVAATGLVWDRVGDHQRVSRDAGVGQDGNGLFPRGFGQDDDLRSDPGPRWCRRTETGIQCQAPGTTAFPQG